MSNDHTPPPEKKKWGDNLPFPRHWLYYIAAKIFILALLVYIALKWKGLL